MHAHDVAIRDETIKLGQFIKLANLTATGGEAKELIAGGQVTVNGDVDTRRGRTLRHDDVVCIAEACARGMEPAGEDTGAAADAGEGDFFDEATADDDFDPEKWRNL